MSQTIETHSSRVELDKAFQHAVTLAWEDLMKPIDSISCDGNFELSDRIQIGSERVCVSSGKN